MPPSATPSLRWVNEKRIDGKLVTLYRNEKRELVLVVSDIDAKGNKVKEKKPKLEKVAKDKLKQIWR